MDYQTKRKHIIIIFSVILSILVVYTVIGSVLVTRDLQAQALASERGRLQNSSRGRLHSTERGRLAEANITENQKGTEENPGGADQGDRIAAVQNRLVRQPLVTPRGNGEDTVTVMVYMNGSNLETDYGFATQDIREMLKAPYNEKVNIVIETLGTKKWQDYGIMNDHTQRFILDEKDVLLVDDTLDQLDCTDPDTLTDFITWSAKKYPADRYFLILWDHGGGAVDGFGWDQYRRYDASLTIDELQQSLKEAGVVFDFIGMDACIMSSIETCYAVYDYCDYCILSEDFESALGWSYEGWLTALSENTSIDTVSLGILRGTVDHPLGVIDARDTGPGPSVEHEFEVSGSAADVQHAAPSADPQHADDLVHPGRGAVVFLVPNGIGEARAAHIPVLGDLVDQFHVIT